MNVLFFYFLFLRPPLIILMVILQSSAVRVSQVLYKNIKGTSSTQAAMTFRCSSSNPCFGIKLQDIKLTYVNALRRPTVAYCEHAGGSTTGSVSPRSCFQHACFNQFKTAYIDFVYRTKTMMILSCFLAKGKLSEEHFSSCSQADYIQIVMILNICCV